MSKTIEKIIKDNTQGLYAYNGYEEYYPVTPRMLKPMLKVLADHLLGLPSLQEVDLYINNSDEKGLIEAHKNKMKRQIRQEIAELLGAQE